MFLLCPSPRGSRVPADGNSCMSQGLGSSGKAGELKKLGHALKEPDHNSVSPKPVLPLRATCDLKQLSSRVAVITDLDAAAFASYQWQRWDLNSRSQPLAPGQHLQALAAPKLRNPTLPRWGWGPSQGKSGCLITCRMASLEWATSFTSHQQEPCQGQLQGLSRGAGSGVAPVGHVHLR